MWVPERPPGLLPLLAVLSFRLECLAPSARPNLAHEAPKEKRKKL